MPATESEVLGTDGVGEAFLSMNLCRGSGNSESEVNLSTVYVWGNGQIDPEPIVSVSLQTMSGKSLHKAAQTHQTKAGEKERTEPTTTQ